MAQAKRDENRVTTLLGVSSVDSSTPVAIEADPTTKALYIDVVNGGTLESAVDGIEALLTTIDADTSAIKTAVEILDNTVAGNEMQVDVITMPTTTVTATNLDIRDLTNASDSVAIYGSDDGGTTKRIIKTDSGGAIQVDLEVASVAVSSIAAGDNNIGNVDIVTVPAPLNVVGGGTEAAALRVTLANDSTGVISVDDNGGALTVDGSVNATLQAADGVDIGNVDVASIAAGTNVIGKVRLVTATGDEITEDTDDSIQVTIVADDVGIGGGTQYTLGTDTYTEATTVGTVAGAVRNDALATLVDTDNEIAPLQVDAQGALFIQPVDSGGTAITETTDHSMNVTIVADDVGIGGGTQYDEDDAVPANPTGTAILAERDDALGGITPAEGDWTQLFVDANGALWTNVSNTVTVDLGANNDVTLAVLPDTAAGDLAAMVVDLAAIEVLLGTIDTDTGAIATDIAALEVLQTDIETNTDSLAVVGGGAEATALRVTIANDSTGVVTVDGGAGGIEVVQDTAADLNMTEANSGDIKTAVEAIQTAVEIIDDWDASDVLKAGGNVAHDAADAGNPLKIGGRAQDIIGANPEEVADDDRVDALFDRNGRLGVTSGFDFKYADINDSTSGDNTIIAASAGKRICVWAILIVSDGTVDVRWEDGAGGTAFTGQIPLQEREGYSISAGGLVPLFVGSSNTLLNLELSAAINVHGFVSYTLDDD